MLLPPECIPECIPKSGIVARHAFALARQKSTAGDVPRRRPRSPASREPPYCPHPVGVAGLGIIALADTAHLRLTDSQRLDWLRLFRSENVGPRTFRSLVNHCGGAGAALAALPDLARRGGASRALRVCAREDAEREMAAALRIGARFVALGEADYPAYLQTVEDAPPLLALRGDADVLRAPLIAMVGSRNASATGVKMAERLARELGAAGFGVVSGWRAASTPPPTARALPPAPSRCSLADRTASIRRNMLPSSMRCWNPGRRSRKCRSAGSRAPATSPAATD
jgi:hypothetical protein